MDQTPWVQSRTSPATTARLTDSAAGCLPRILIRAATRCLGFLEKYIQEGMDDAGRLPP